MLREAWVDSADDSDGDKFTNRVEADQHKQIQMENNGTVEAPTFWKPAKWDVWISLFPGQRFTHPKQIGEIQDGMAIFKKLPPPGMLS